MTEKDIYDIYYKGIVGEAAQEHQQQAEALIEEFVRKYADRENEK